MLQTETTPAVDSLAVQPQKPDGQPIEIEAQPQWYALRDLSRANARQAGWQRLREAGLEVFTPLRWQLRVRAGRRERVQAPVVRDLLFVRGTRPRLDEALLATPGVQYRYVRGGYRLPMTVPAAQMDRFMQAVSCDPSPRYYRPEELTPQLLGRRVRISCGPLAGWEGRLLALRGSRVRRLLVSLPSLLTAAVEVQAEYVQIV